MSAVYTCASCGTGVNPHTDVRSELRIAQPEATSAGRRERLCEECGREAIEVLGL